MAYCRGTRSESPMKLHLWRTRAVILADNRTSQRTRIRRVQHWHRLTNSVPLAAVKYIKPFSSANDISEQAHVHYLFDLFSFSF